MLRLEGYGFLKETLAPSSPHILFSFPGIKAPILKSNQKVAKSLQEPVYICCDGLLIVNSSIYEAIKSLPQQASWAKPHFNCTCRRNIPVLHEQDHSQLKTASIITVIVVLISLFFTIFIYQGVSRQFDAKLESRQSQQFAQVQWINDLLVERISLHKPAPDIYKKLESVGTLRNQSGNRLARGVDLGRVQKSRKSTNQSFFRRVKDEEDRQRIQTLRVKEKKLRLKARFLALSDRIRKEFVDEGRIPDVPFQRRHSVYHGQFNSKTTNRLFASFRLTKSKKKPEEISFTSKIETLQVNLNSSVSNNSTKSLETTTEVEVHIGPPVATSTLIKNDKPLTPKAQRFTKPPTPPRPPTANLFVKVEGEPTTTTSNVITKAALCLAIEKANRYSKASPPVATSRLLKKEEPSTPKSQKPPKPPTPPKPPKVDLFLKGEPPKPPKPPTPPNHPAITNSSVKVGTITGKFEPSSNVITNDLAKAIANFSKANLRSVKDLKAAEETSKSGDMVSDLTSKLAMRRNSVIGIGISNLIPGPALPPGMEPELTDDEDDEDDDDWDD